MELRAEGHAEYGAAGFADAPAAAPVAAHLLLLQVKSIPQPRLVPLAAAYVAYIVLCNLSLKVNTVGFYQVGAACVYGGRAPVGGGVSSFQSQAGPGGGAGAAR